MRFLFFILLFSAFSSLRSQEPFPKNNFVYVEGLGSGGYYSLNYEKTLMKGMYSRAFLRAGLSVTYDGWMRENYPDKRSSDFIVYNIPLILGSEVGTKQFRYEYGLGLVSTIGEVTRHYNMLTTGKNSKYGFTVAGILGLRYYCKKQPLFFRLTYTPFYEDATKSFIPLWFGASVGLTF